MLTKEWSMVLGDKNDNEYAPLELLSFYWIMMVVSTKYAEEEEEEEKKMLFPSHYC